MKLTYDRFLASIKTKSEVSLAVNEVWISRSVVGVKKDGEIKPVFGFGAAFSQKRSEASSVYELLEHLIFLPFMHDKESLSKPVSFISADIKDRPTKDSVQEYLIGSLGPRGIFSANGCAVSTNVGNAVTHAKRELIERHLCCEIWYKRAHPLLPCSEFKIKTLMPSVKLEVYTTDVAYEGAFAIASLECMEESYFVLGAAIKSNLKDACDHAASEVLMLYNDVIQKRTESNSTDQSKRNILSLRDKKTSHERKMYFESLSCNNSTKRDYVNLVCKSIVFEPLPNIYAARAFSTAALDPRQFDVQGDIPLLPLF